MNLKYIHFVFIQLLLILFLSLSSENILFGQNKTYYVDSNNGNDALDGLSVNNAWKTFQNINSKTFQPGDSILLKCGSIFAGQLYPKGSGQQGKQITIGKYGSGYSPLIAGNGEISNLVCLFNQEYWTVRDLEITNYKAGSVTVKRGVYVGAMDFGTVQDIKLINLKIHDINSNIEIKDGGGIFLEITGSVRQTKFDNLLIEGCEIVDVDRTGISNVSSWDNRSLTSNTNWYPSTNVKLKNNWIERSGGNGAIIRVASFPVIENNTFKQCGVKTSGNAVFVFNCDDAVMQYNEVYQTVYNAGDEDASALDADFRCKRTIIQYNYSHDNDDGFLVVCCQGGSTRFNDGTIVRYNISQNDGGRGGQGAIIRLSGQTTNTKIYNNVIYSGSGNSFKKAIYHKSWDAYPDNSSYYNNIFYLGTAPVYSFTSSTANYFNNNLFYGTHSSNEPYDPKKLISDPMFENPDAGAIGINTLNGYRLRPGSPCIDSGYEVVTGIKDFFGNMIPGNGKVDVGAHEYNGIVGVEKKNQEMPKNAHLMQNYPNPFNPETKITYFLPAGGWVKLKVYDILGKELSELKNKEESSGYHTAVWNGNIDSGSPAPSGVYFCRLEHFNIIKSIKMILLR